MWITLILLENMFIHRMYVPYVRIEEVCLMSAFYIFAVGYLSAKY